MILFLMIVQLAQNAILIYFAYQSHKENQLRK